ncbi:hypothetical protein RRG08_048679 [Elysia crispata]|uniref:Uncharacterized protein n=1 Tax=Elysia crispata TaxID=231223 RepID=A0AAE1ADI5_9GAST|nr:hypothetical protein RRG08_048679 [Elysia crispata]
MIRMTLLIYRKMARMALLICRKINLPGRNSRLKLLSIALLFWKCTGPFSPHKQDVLPSHKYVPYYVNNSHSTLRLL